MTRCEAQEAMGLLCLATGLRCVGKVHLLTGYALHPSLHGFPAWPLVPQS